MVLTCTGCNGKSEIADPTDESWQYNLTEVYGFQDDGTRYVEGKTGEREIVWKCARVVPTDDNPNGLCGTTNVITEAWSE